MAYPIIMVCTNLTPAQFLWLFCQGYNTRFMRYSASENRSTAAFRQIYYHWPTYLMGYGGGAIFSIVVAIISFAQGWWSFIPLLFALLLVLTYFFVASLWLAYTRNEAEEAHLLLAWAQLSTTDSLAYLDLGQRHLALRLVSYLTTGKITIIDVYNPQLTASAALARARTYTPPLPQGDPRIHGLEGSCDLLPLPDKCVPVVILPYILTEFWQHGDREQLLREVYRILKPGGRLILLESVRHPANVVVLGPLVWGRPAAAYWQTVLTQAGFSLRKEQSLQSGLTQAFRADKPVQYQNRQLDLGF
jgi:ubiquinone/menaquinone biosynthesis C-methylase UbiE